MTAVNQLIVVNGLLSDGYLVVSCWFTMRDQWSTMVK